jgi:hypothetical protein
MANLTLLAQTYNVETEMSGGVAAILFVIYAAVVVLMIAAGWRVFTKAGQPGWAILIPFYNYYVFLRIVGRPWYWLLLYFIPIVGFVLLIIVLVDLAKSFGKGGGFAVGLLFLPFIFLPILAWGSAQYVGPSAAPPAPAA